MFKNDRLGSKQFSNINKSRSYFHFDNSNNSSSSVKPEQFLRQLDKM